MNGIEKSKQTIEKIFEIKDAILKNKIYLLQFIIYSISNLILLYLIFISSKEIIKSKLITLFLDFYFQDGFIAITTLIGLVGALTILIGHILSENEERIIGREGKLWSGLTFWHRNFLTNASSLILIIIFTKTYYGTLNYFEVIIFILLIIVLNITWVHFIHHVTDAYDWDILENKEYKIHLDKFFGVSSFGVGFLLYIYSLQFVETLVFNILNIWILFLSIIFLASFKYPRTKKIILKYLNNEEEYAHLVRIEDGFARIITKYCGSKQINLNEIKSMNYDNKYIENFKRSLNQKYP